MSNRLRWLALSLLGIAASGALLWYTEARSTRTAHGATAPRFSPAQLLDSNIAFYEGVARRDPTGGMALGQLALFYMRRARATGDYQDVLRSETAARTSLNNRGAHNTRARQALAASLLSEHRFGDALGVAQDLSERDASNAAFRASLGEIQMELGHYDDARASFASVAGNTSDLSVAPRLARWAELNGHPDSAYRLMNTSLLAVVDRRDVPAEQKAWFWLRMGDLQFRRGKIDEAASDYQKGLDAHTDDYRLLSGMAKLEAARHDWKRAIDYGERSVAVSFDPATLGAISDAYAGLGDSAKADEYAHAMEIAVSKQATAYHRAWSLFLLDHRRRVGEVLAKAQEELTTRRDIYGYDVVAWALHASGRDPEARDMMTRALSLGTQDAMLFYHAATIDRALGRSEIATRELAHARTLNPYLADGAAE
ncbi:MAG TPA: tetratricopeptide repeat protein [Gemmatimonadaceae bacterium]|nr:tetratricopeptide repeat protein [Gemmatimonadaceae bacterium]